MPCLAVPGGGVVHRLRPGHHLVCVGLRLPLEVVGRVGNPQPGTVVRAGHRAFALLDDMGEFVGEGVFVAAAGAEYDMAAGGVGAGADGAGRAGGRGPGVQPYVGEVGTEAGLHVPAYRSREGFAGRAQHLVHSGVLLLHGGCGAGAAGDHRGHRGVARAALRRAEAAAVSGGGTAGPPADVSRRAAAGPRVACRFSFCSACAPDVRNALPPRRRSPPATPSGPPGRTGCPGPYGQSEGKSGRQPVSWRGQRKAMILPLARSPRPCRPGRTLAQTRPGHR